MELNLETIKAIKTIVNAMLPEGDVQVRINYMGNVKVTQQSGRVDDITSIAQDVKRVEVLAEETINGGCIEEYT